MSDHKRAQNIANATAGAGLVGAGEALGHVVGRRGGARGFLASQVLPRGLGAVGVPLAASGAVGAARGQSKPERVHLTKLPGQVVRHTVSLPKDPRKAKSEQARDTATALLAGGVGGLAARRVARSPRGKIAAGTIGSLTTASSALYGRQKGRERQRRVKLAKDDHPKTFRMPVPTVADTHEDWKSWKARKRTANTSVAAAGVGAAALAARTPHLVQRKNPSPRTLRLRAHGNKASEVLGVGAATAGLYSAITGYHTARQDLNTQARRLRERDALLGRRSPVKKDGFTRRYAQHISPSAEQGYEYLRRGRNRQARSAVINGVLTGANAASAIRGGRVARPVGTALGIYTGVSAIRSARGAHRWNAKMGKIKAKAYERAAAGVYGSGREVAKDDLAKAMFRVRTRPAGLPFPKGLRRAPALRPGGVRRTSGGGLAVFRGSYG